METKQKPRVSVVVPVFAGSRTLPELYQRLKATLDQSGHSFELILVDDRGDPDAWGVVKELTREHLNVVGIRLGRNFGQHAATLCGIAQAQGDWVVTMDEDLEHQPESLPSMLSRCDDDLPLVYGVFQHRTHASYRNITSELMRWTLKRAFPELNEEYSSFRVMRSSLAMRLISFEMHRPYIDGMLSWLTSGVATVDVGHGKREHGASAYTMRKLVSHAINIFITFSNLPLRIASYGGAVLALLSTFYLFYIIWLQLTGGITSPGYASLMSVVLFACGIQLVILGVLGEYVGRLMGAANRKPMYSIQERASSSQ